MAPHGGSFFFENDLDWQKNFVASEGLASLGYL